MLYPQSLIIHAHRGLSEINVSASVIQKRLRDVNEFSHLVME
ncbi:hypothetical protein PCH70_14450 [Pseudomonas cichorii JBC1]|nr:hypothetical protein PCH70_14450 [Pseudomonas cichorii JBC1]